MESALELRTLGKNDGPIVEKLFGKNGACGGCWCMYWHRPTHGKAWDAVKGERNRRDFLRLIKQGKLKAMLAFRAGEAVGWCCYGPKLSFAKLAKSSRLRRDGDEAAWAIVCLYLAAKARRQGIGTQLIAAAADAALAEGASELEGYPKDVAKGTTTAGAFIWTGTSGQYRKAGFSKIKRAEGLRPIYLRCA